MRREDEEKGQDNCEGDTGSERAVFVHVDASIWVQSDPELKIEKLLQQYSSRVCDRCDLIMRCDLRQVQVTAVCCTWLYIR